MSQFLKFYFTSSLLNMFRTLIHPSSGACDFCIVPPHWLCVPVLMCIGVSAWLVGEVAVWQASCPKHVEQRRSEIKLQKSWHQVGLLFSNYHNDARTSIHKIYLHAEIWTRDFSDHRSMIALWRCHVIFRKARLLDFVFCFLFKIRNTADKFRKLVPFPTTGRTVGHGYWK